MSRIKDKIKEIETYLEELTEIVPKDLSEYAENKLIKAACERYFEKIIEATTDLAFLIISSKKLEIPQEDIDAFKILFKHEFISEELCEKLKQAKGMRNILAHQYGIIDDEIVFESLNNELEKDIKHFLKMINIF
ncbi:hypothetical protein COV11_04805 [Candidatus Woesearchaeota archaeon CG10_big_fil_rev_8_21_14_0_10_30_7]|nr:MAG: hypothetical protein COV11_04805 [Candidatus Woesearchaeota archaeon CG10_big_fil_rev_8_21_14_0_10_30_7]